MDFFRFIPKTTKPYSKLVTFDIIGLNTNISHHLGINAVKYWICKERDGIDSWFDEDFILDALNIVLERNTLELCINNVMALP